MVQRENGNSNGSMVWWCEVDVQCSSVSARGESRGAKRITDQRLHLRQRCSEARAGGKDCGDEGGGSGSKVPLTSSASSRSCSSIASRSLGAEKDPRSLCSCSAE